MLEDTLICGIVDLVTPIPTSGDLDSDLVAGIGAVLLLNLTLVLLLILVLIPTCVAGCPAPIVLLHTAQPATHTKQLELRASGRVALAFELLSPLTL